MDTFVPYRYWTKTQFPNRVGSKPSLIESLGILVPEKNETSSKLKNKIVLSEDFYFVTNSAMLSLGNVSLNNGEVNYELYQAVRLTEAVRVSGLKVVSKAALSGLNVLKSRIDYLKEHKGDNGTLKELSKKQQELRRGINPRNPKHVSKAEKKLQAGSLLLKKYHPDSSTMLRSSWYALTPEEQQFQNLLRVGLKKNCVVNDLSEIRGEGDFFFFSSIYPDLFEQKFTMDDNWSRRTGLGEKFYCAHLGDIGLLSGLGFGRNPDKQPELMLSKNSVSEARAFEKH